MSNKPKSYQDAFDELQSLSEKLEGNEVAIDELTKVVQRANELVKFCQDQLRKTEASLNQEGT